MGVCGGYVWKLCWMSYRGPIYWKIPPPGGGISGNVIRGKNMKTRREKERKGEEKKRENVKGKKGEREREKGK